jgi:cellulose synthase/poly-beta-1,6-N-acetylglucosamine synthase-like glycosyltransferase
MRKAQPAASQTMIWSLVRRAHASANRNPGKLFLIGLAGVVAYNWRQWQRDKALAARLRSARTPIPKLSRTPKVSALVAAWNEHDHIDAHIRSFLALTYPDIELILCAGGDDDTLERARRYASERVIVLEQHPGEGKQRALARCLEHASGELIYLTDADCLYDDEALTRLLAVLINEREVAVTGRFAPLPTQRTHPFICNQWAVDTYARARSGAYIRGLIGRNAALIRTALIESRALEAVVPIGTDYYLAKRLIAQGQRIRYVHDSIVATHYHAQIRPYMRQQTRWLRNVVVHGRRFGAYDEVTSAIRNCGIGAMATGMSLLWPFLGSLALAVWLVIFVFVTVNRIRYLNFTQECGQHMPQSAYTTAPIYAVLDLYTLASAGLDMLLRRRDRW